MPVGLNLVVCLATPYDGTVGLLNHLSKAKLTRMWQDSTPPLNIWICREQSGRSSLFFFFAHYHSVWICSSKYTLTVFLPRFPCFWCPFVSCASPCFLRVVASVVSLRVCAPPLKVCVCGRREGAPGVVYDKRIDVNVYRSHSHAVLPWEQTNHELRILTFRLPESIRAHRASKFSASIDVIGNGSWKHIFCSTCQVLNWCLLNVLAGLGQLWNKSDKAKYETVIFRVLAADNVLARSCMVGRLFWEIWESLGA